MAIARALVEVEAVLRAKSDVDLFLPIERSGLLSCAESATVLSYLAETRLGDPASIMRLCLQALRIQHEEMSPRFVEAELVATLPPDVPGLARPTDRVLREMLARSINEVIVLGYEVTDSEVVQLLAEAATRGADVVMICDRGRGAARRILEGWPAGAPLPRLFHDRVRIDGAPHASMHAKCLLVDGRDLLITSANFTFHGLHGNIEIGIRLGGEPAAEARKMFSHLVESGILETCQ